MRESDSELERIIKGCLENNRLSQKQLYERYASLMYAVCRRYANSAVEAEDMLMEGFMNIFRNLHTYRQESEFRSWMNTVMVNSAISHYRSFRRFRKEEAVERLEECVLEADASDMVVAGMDAARAVELMEQMPDTLRMVFNLKEIEGYSFGEIAGKLGKSESAVRVACMRARRWLQKAMGF